MELDFKETNNCEEDLSAVISMATTASNRNMYAVATAMASIKLLPLFIYMSGNICQKVYKKK